MPRSGVPCPRRARLAARAAACLLAGTAWAADLSAPVDVPDEIGLGERLALVAWLGEHKIPVADAHDLRALRLAYLTRVHPDQVVDPDAAAKEQDRQRGELAAELFRKHGVNPPAGADAEAIRAQIAKLDADADAALARDQAAARADGRQPRARAQPQAPPTPPRVAPPPPSALVPPGAGQAPRDPERDAARAAVGIAVGKPFPGIAARALDGAPFSLAQWRGKVVLVDFWATWCGPCMQELPNVKAVYQTYHQRGFEVIGASLDQDQAELRRVLDAQAIPWPQLFDGGGWDSAIARQCAVRAIPAAFLIAKDGTLIAADLRGAALAAAVAKALGLTP